MWYFRIITCLLVLSSMFTSCELFGGGDKGGETKGGELVWKVENGTKILVGTQPLIEDGIVYFVQDGYLKAYTLSEGKKKWSTETGKPNYGRTLLESGNKIFLDEGLTVQAHRKSDGSLIWETWITEDAAEISGIGSPVMSQDENYLYVGRKGYVVKLSKSDGKIMRRYPLNRLVPEGITQGSTEPIISSFGDNKLYISTSYWDNRSASYPEEASGGNIFAYNTITGELIWERHIEVAVPNPYPDVPSDSLISSPFIEDIAVTENKIIALAGSYIVALNRISGETLWKTYFAEGGFDVGLIISNKSVYAASSGTFAARLDLDNGKKVWKQDIIYSNTSIPTVKNGRMYFTNSGGGSIWVLDTKDGSVIYRERPPGFKNDNFDVYISSLGVGEGYMVNVGSQAVYCLTVP